MSKVSGRKSSQVRIQSIETKDGKRKGQHLVQSHKRGVASWLFTNTCLTFDQIAEFCGISKEEMDGIANDEVIVPHPVDPVSLGLITKEDIGECESNSSLNLTDVASGHVTMAEGIYGNMINRKGSNIAKRRDKPSAVAWIVTNHPYVGDSQIVELVGTTKNTIIAIREKTHWNIDSIKPKNPVDLGLCSKDDLEQIIAYARMSHERKEILSQMERDGMFDSLPNGPIIVRE